MKLALNTATDTANTTFFNNFFKPSLQKNQWLGTPNAKPQAQMEAAL